MLYHSVFVILRRRLDAEGMSFSGSPCIRECVIMYGIVSTIAYKSLEGVSPNLQVRCSWGWRQILIKFRGQKVKCQGPSDCETTYGQRLHGEIKHFGGVAFCHVFPEYINIFNETYHSSLLPDPHDFDVILRSEVQRSRSQITFRRRHIDRRFAVEDRL